MSVVLDLATRLQTEGVGTIGTDVFMIQRPPTPDTCVTLATYTGDPNRLHDADYQPADERLAVNVVVRGATYPAAEPLAAQVFAAITFRHETLQSGSTYAYCRASSYPAFLGRDENHRPLLAFNVTLRRHA